MTYVGRYVRLPYELSYERRFVKILLLGYWCSVGFFVLQSTAYIPRYVSVSK